MNEPLHYAAKFGIAAAIIAAVVASTIDAPGAASRQAGINTSNLSSQNGPTILRIGYFPNISHAQAVIGLGTGDFQKALGPNVQIQTQTFNSGPLEIEALLAGQVDVAYVGPSPAINGFIKSGDGLKVIAGSASGGAVFVVRNDSSISSVKDFAGKKFAAPELGNTQDTALRKYLIDNGYKTVENGGNVTVTEAANSEIFTLMVKKQLDGAWVPEPWGAKLIKEANCKIFLDERSLWPNGDFASAEIVSSSAYLEKNPDVVEKLLVAHINETLWINSNQVKAMKVFDEQLVKLTGKTIPSGELLDGLSRLKLTYDPVKDSLQKDAQDAYELGFLKQQPDISKLYDLTLLNQATVQEGVKSIQ